MARGRQNQPSHKGDRISHSAKATESAIARGRQNQSSLKGDRRISHRTKATKLAIARGRPNLSSRKGDRIGERTEVAESISSNTGERQGDYSKRILEIIRFLIGVECPMNLTTSFTTRSAFFHAFRRCCGRGLESVLQEGTISR